MRSFALVLLMAVFTTVGCSDATNKEASEAVKETGEALDSAAKDAVAAGEKAVAEGEKAMANVKDAIVGEDPAPPETPEPPSP